MAAKLAKKMQICLNCNFFFKKPQFSESFQNQVATLQCKN